MSKVTRPDTEGSVTCGFFNSVNDRYYDATQMSAIFDGVINDGIFASVGTAFTVKASTGNTVTVGTGKAWLNHTWTNNDAILPVECDASEVLLDRIDAIVIEVNATDDVRDNRIQVIKGTPASTPSRPTLTNTEKVHQHPLCYITRPAGSSAITNSQIRNVIGTETPYVTGIVKVLDLKTILSQWQSELDEFITSQESEVDTFVQNKESEYNTWYSGMVDLMAATVIEVNNWTVAEKNTIMTWFNEVKGQLSEDSALNLQIQIDNNEIEKILMEGLSDGTKTISEDGTVIKTVNSKGLALTKTFTDNFQTIISVLTDREIKEYLLYPYVAFNGEKTVTRYGVTFTDNGDGTVTANGTATGLIWFILPGNDFTLPQDTYSLSGCPVGGSEETYYFGVSLYNDTTIVANSTANDIGYGATLDTTNKTYTSARVFICIKSGVTVNDITFNPKVRTFGSELGKLVKTISADGKTITSVLTGVDPTNVGQAAVISDLNTPI